MTQKRRQPMRYEQNMTLQRLPFPFLQISFCLVESRKGWGGGGGGGGQRRGRERERGMRERERGGRRDERKREG